MYFVSLLNDFLDSSMGWWCWRSKGEGEEAWARRLDSRSVVLRERSLHSRNGQASHEIELTARKSIEECGIENLNHREKDAKKVSSGCNGNAADNSIQEWVFLSGTESYWNEWLNRTWCRSCCTGDRWQRKTYFEVILHSNVTGYWTEMQDVVDVCSIIPCSCHQPR